MAKAQRLVWMAIIVIPFVLAAVDTAARTARYFDIISVRQNLDLSVSRDNGFAEIAGFAELLSAIVLLVMAGNRLHDNKLRIVAGVIFYLVVDDMFLIHDQARELLASALFSSHSHDKAIEFGETVYFAAAILVIAAVLILAYCNASRMQHLRASLLVGGLAVFAFFAVALDEIGSLLNSFGIISDRVYRNLAMVEDTGELFASGLILMAALVLFRMGQEAAADPPAQYRTD
jgi:hypothetical protein